MSNLRFFYNGIKVGKESLQKAHYSFTPAREEPKGVSKPRLYIYARDYARFSGEVRDQFEVINNTDSMTDYFERDHIEVYPDHPLFKAVAEAYLKQVERQVRMDEKKGRESQGRDLKYLDELRDLIEGKKTSFRTGDLVKIRSGWAADGFGIISEVFDYGCQVVRPNGVSETKVFSNLQCAS